MTSHHCFVRSASSLISLASALVLATAALAIGCSSGDSKGNEQGAASGSAGSGGNAGGTAGAGGSEPLEQVPETQGLVIFRLDKRQSPPHVVGGVVFTPYDDERTWSFRVRRSNCTHWRATFSPPTLHPAPHAGTVTIESKGFSDSYSPLKNGIYAPILFPAGLDVDAIGEISVQAEGAEIPAFSTSISLFNSSIQVTQPELHYDSSGLAHMSAKKHEPIVVQWEPFEGQLNVGFKAENLDEREEVSCVFSGSDGAGTVPSDFLDGLWSFGSEIHGWYYPENSKWEYVGKYEVFVTATTQAEPDFNQNDTAESSYFVVDTE